MAGIVRLTSSWPSCKPSDNAELAIIKRGGSSMILKNRPITRHYQTLQKITQRAQRCVARTAHDNVVENFYFQQLAGPNEITRDFDVRLGRSRITARMI